MGTRTRQRLGATRRMCALVVAVLVARAAPVTAAGPGETDREWDAGRAWEPRPMTTAKYTRGERVTGHASASDGARVFVETFLPGEKDGSLPPARVPVVLVMTPYADLTATELRPALGLRNPQQWSPTIDYFTARGYAVAIGHVLGTGSSEGCIQVGGPKEVDATAAVVDHLARTPWSNGRVGMFGASYEGMTQLAAAALDDPRVRPLKAIVPVAASMSWIENAAFDGVPSVPGITFGWALYNGVYTSLPGRDMDPTLYARRHACAADALGHAVTHDVSGDLTPYWRERDYRWGVGNVRAATLMFQGFFDEANPPLGIAGFFERIPASTPHKLMLGQWEHAFPHTQNTHPQWRRADFLPMVQAWYDRYLLDLPTGVESWPEVQVQDTRGQWRAEKSWPDVTQRYGHLPLTDGGSLGAAAPSGATTYSETGVGAPRVTFTTPPLADDLHLTGQSILDLWVQLDQPDAHIAVNVSALDAAGNQVGPVAFYGARSARHLDPMPENWFRQEGGRDAPTGTPVRIPVRLSPTDFLVPKGGRLTVTVGVALPYINGFPSAPSGAGTTVTILHDCAHPSALRFFLPGADADLLNVREPHEGTAPLASHPARRGATDGGGLATAPVCGQRPLNSLAVVAGEA